MDQVDSAEPQGKTADEYLELGNQCYNDQKYPEASYWYFQAYAETTNENFQAAYTRSADSWIGFDQFLDQFWARGDVNESTEWKHVQDLWENIKDIRALYKTSLKSIPELNNIRNRCCRIIGIKEDQSMVTATGFLAEYIGEKFIMTNHHALDHANTNFVAEFSDPNGGPENVFSMLSTNFVANKEYDVGIAMYLNKTIRTREHFDLNKLGNPEATDAVVILQHPRGLEIHQSIGVICDKGPDEIDYTASTDRGSSGSFVLGADWNPIALHKCGVETVWHGKKTTVNRGTRFETVRQWMKDNEKDIIARLRNLKKVTSETEMGDMESKCDGTEAILLREIKQMQNSVCQIKTPEGSGSGFLAIYKGTRFVVTSANLMKKSISPPECSACFSSLKKRDEIYLDDPPITLNFTEECEVSQKLGISLVGYEFNKDLVDRYHFNLVTGGLGDNSPHFYGKGDSMTTFQRPDTEEKFSPLHQSIGTIKKIENEKIFYDAGARSGSEGGVVLSAEWKPLAVHISENPAVLLNEGVLLSHVTRWIEQDNVMTNFQSGKTDGLDEDDEAIIRLLNEKKVNVSVMAQKLNISESAIQSCVDTLPEPVDITQLDEDDRFLIRKLIKKNRATGQIAKKLGHTTELIQAFMDYEAKQKEISALDDDDIFLLKSMLKKKRTVQQISTKLGHPEELVRAFISSQKAGLNISISGLDSIDHYIIDALHEKKRKPVEIAGKMGKTTEAIKEYFKLSGKS